MASTRFLLLLSLYVLLSSTCIVLAAEAFSPSRLIVSKKWARATNNNNKHFSTTNPPLRGGGIMKSTNDSNDDNKDESTILQEDLKSMQFCYRAALFSTAATIYTQQGASLQTMFTSFSSLLDVVSHLNILGFGFGVWRISKAYAKDVSDSTPTNLLSLTNTLKIVWFNVWSVLTLGTVALSTSLKGIVGGDSNYTAPVTVAAIALASVFIISNTTAKPPERVGVTKDDSTLHQARVSGFVAARNMEFSMAGFAIEAVVTCITTLSSSETTLLNKCIGMLDVMEPAIIFILVKELVKAFRPAVTRATDPKTFSADEGYAPLYAAETGFYTKIGNVLLFPALTKLATPHLLMVYEIIKKRYFG